MATKKKAAKPGAADKVDWKSLKTSHGPATRVPTLVRALVEGETPEDRNDAYVALREGLRGNGVVSTSAAPMVPLLCEVLVSREEGAHRAGWLIGEALTAGHARILADAKARITGAAAAVRAAVKAQEGVLLSTLSDPDARFRAAAAFALAWADELASRTLPALRKQVATETNDAAAESELLAVGLLASASGDRTPVDAIGVKGPLSMGGAALERVLRESKVHGVDAEAIVALLRAPFEQDGTPWWDNVVDRLVVAIASHANVADELAVAIASKVDDQGPGSSWGFVTAALLTLGGFEARWDMNDVALVEELSPVQKAIATGLSRRDGVVVGFGLPQSARVRRRWLGIDPAGPLERRMPLEKKQQPIWKVWRSQRRLTMKDPVPPAIAERLDADETLVALAEVETNAYGIRTLLGGAPLAAALLVETAERTSAKAAAWARAYADEILALVEARSQPELGGVIGMRAAVACFLAILNHGGTVEPRWYRFLPLFPADVARLVLEKMPGDQREAAVWEAMSQPFPPHDPIAKLVVPILDLAASKRICDALVARLAKARPPGPPAMLTRIQAIRSRLGS